MTNRTENIHGSARSDNWALNELAKLVERLERTQKEEELSDARSVCRVLERSRPQR